MTKRFVSQTFTGVLRDAALTLTLYLAPRLASALLFVFIGRMAGPSAAGVFTLATTYLLIFTALTRGLDDLLIRQVARAPQEARAYLGSFTLLRLGLSLALYGALAALVLGVFHYPRSTALPILVLAFSVLPDSLANVAQAALVGQRRFVPPTLVLTAASLLKLGVGLLALTRGGGPLEVAWIWLGGSTLGMAALLIVAFSQAEGARGAGRLDLRPLLDNRGTALSFLALAVLATLESQTDTLLLSAFRSAEVVGYYSAATTVAFSLVMVSQSYRFAVYPLMTRYAQQAPAKLARLYEQSLGYLAALALPAVAGILALAPRIVALVFGPQFGPTVPALQILILSVIFVFLTEPIARMMYVSDRQNTVVWFMLAGTITNITLNLLLIPSRGATGAALARVCSTGLFMLLNYQYVQRRLAGVNPVRVLAAPLLAATTMAGIVVGMGHWSLPLTIGVGVAVYGLLLWPLALVTGQPVLPPARGGARPAGGKMASDTPHPPE